VDIYASDEEKAEAIKQWWRDNGRSVVVGVVLGGAAVFGFRYWTTQQAIQSEQASVLYQQAVIQMNQSEVEPAGETVLQLQEDYSSTAYSVFAALELAEKATKENELALAQTHLTWVMDNAKLSGHRELARLRLVQINLQEGEFKEASSLIDSAETSAFSSLFSELEGDVELAQGNVDAAREAYQRAFVTLSAGEPRQSVLH
jgi:predicted negative regulator of RcsB-dependent stress response